MRIFVATMHSGENELDRCVASVRKQTHSDYYQEVVSGLADKAAHDFIYGKFSELSNQFDLMVKLDADMVIVRDDFFEKLVELFSANPGANMASIDVHDFFSAGLLPSLNVYRNSRAWTTDPGECLFTDYVGETPGEKLTEADRLAPAAWHCPDPSDLQCFHYGVHRALKIVQRGRLKNGRIYSKSRGQMSVLERVWQNFVVHRDRRVGLSVLGSELAFRGAFETIHLSYADHTLGEVLSRYASLGVDELYTLTQRLRLLNFGWLPADRRKAALRYLRGGNLLDREALRDFLGTALRFPSRQETGRT